MSNRNIIILVSAIAAMVALYFYRPGNLYFLADDFIHIPASQTSLLIQRNSLRPVGNISLYFDGLISGTSAYGYHFTNLILHLINTCLVFVSARVLFRYFNAVSQKLFPLVAAALFCTYPFHSEAAFWIIGRSGQLGTLFFLPALIMFLKRKKPFYFVLSLLFLECSLLSYESSWIFPLVVVLIAYLKPLENKRREIVYVSSVVALFALHLFFRYWMTNDVFNSYNSSDITHLNLSNLLLNFFRLLARTFLPPFVSARALVIVFAVVVVLISMLLLSMFSIIKKNLLLRFLFIAWLISYIPYLSLGIDTHGVEGERFLYLPSVFFCLMIAQVITLVFKNRLQLIFVVSLFTFNLYYIHRSRMYYEKASLITQSTIETISSLSEKRNIFLENLPQYCRGAVVFRLGFEEAIQWLLPGFAKKIIVVSIDNSDKVVQQKFSRKFLVEEIHTSTIKPVPFIVEKNRTSGEPYLQRPVIQLQFNPQTDAWLRFKENKLVIEK